MKSNLFNNYWALTKEGQDLSEEFDQFMKPLFKKYLEKGYTAMEIEAALISFLCGFAAECKLRHGIEVRKEERTELSKNIENLND